MTPLPGSDNAVRKLLGALASGGTMQDIVTPRFASMVQRELQQRRAELIGLGELRSVDFYRPDQLGGDEYKLTFVNGCRKMAPVVDPEGKIIIASPLAPLDPGE